MVTRQRTKDLGRWEEEDGRGTRSGRAAYLEDMVTEVADVVGIDAEREVCYARQRNPKGV